MNFELIGNVIGAIAVIENLFIFAVMKRENILKLKFLSDALWFLNYLFLGGLTGAILNVVAMCRETVFSFRGKKKFASHVIWLPVFLLLTLVSPALDCISQRAFVPVTLLPAVGSMMLVCALYQKNPRLTKYVALFTQTLWLIYAVMIFNVTAIISNALQIVSALIGILRVLFGKRKEEKGEENSEINNEKTVG